MSILAPFINNPHLARFNEWLDSKPALDAAFTRRQELPDWVQARCLDAFTAGYNHFDNVIAEVEAERRNAKRQALAFIMGVLWSVTVAVLGWLGWGVFA